MSKFSFSQGVYEEIDFVFRPKFAHCSAISLHMKYINCMRYIR